MRRTDLPAVIATMRRLAIGLVGASAVLAAGVGQAALGGRHASIEGDRAHLDATMAGEAMAAAHVAVLHPANGGVIREYSDAGGTVFAVSWRGPGRPDLRQLLGDRFATASTAMASRRGRRTVRLVSVRQAGLVVRSQGRPGAFAGIAYDPRLLPAGFAIDDLR